MRAAEDPVGALRGLGEGRDGLYASVAHQVVDRDVRTPVEGARQVVAAIAGPDVAGPDGAGPDGAAPTG